MCSACRFSLSVYFPLSPLGIFSVLRRSTFLLVVEEFPRHIQRRLLASSVGVTVRVAAGRDRQVVLHALDAVNALRDTAGPRLLVVGGDRARERDDGIVNVHVDGRVPQVVFGGEQGARLRPEPAVVGTRADGTAEPPGLFRERGFLPLVLLARDVGVGLSPVRVRV